MHTILLKLAIFYAVLLAFSLALAGLISLKTAKTGVRRRLGLKILVYLGITAGILSTTLLGEMGIALTISIIVSVGLYEFLALSGGQRALGGLLGIGCLLTAIMGPISAFYLAFSGSAVVVLASMLRSGGEKSKLDSVGTTLVGLVYIPFLGGHFLLLRDSPDFVGHFIFFYVLVIISDAMGLLWGQLLGRHKITPVLSPGKTWEGSILSLVMTVVAAPFLQFALPGISQWTLTVMAGVVGLTSQTGDLVASSFKRAVGVKDFGTWLPTFGGIMDRFDAFIFASPVYAFIVLLREGLF